MKKSMDSDKGMNLSGKYDLSSLYSLGSSSTALIDVNKWKWTKLTQNEELIDSWAPRAIVESSSFYSVNENIGDKSQCILWLFTYKWQSICRYTYFYFLKL